MKAIKSIGILLAVVIGIALIASAILPKTLNVSQQVEIDAPVDIVWSNVSSWEKQDNWSPWYREDSTMKVTYEGTPGTLDSKMLWEGNDEVGTGSQVYTQLDPENHAYTAVTTFIEPWEGTGNASVSVEDLGEGKSKATWTFTQETGFIGNLFTYIFGVENMLNDAYAFGLGKLKAIAEKEAVEKAKEPNYEVTKSKREAINYAVKRTTVSWDSMTIYLNREMPLLQNAAKLAKMQPAGVPSSLVWVWNTENSTAEISVGYPTSEERVPAGYSLFQLPESEYLETVHIGNNALTMEAHQAIESYATSNGLELGEPAIEEYLTDQSTDPDTSNWVTKIIYPIKQAE